MNKVVFICISILYKDLVYRFLERMQTKSRTLLKIGGWLTRIEYDDYNSNKIIKNAKGLE